MSFQFDANDESDTDRFGNALAQALPRGSVVALIGTLGAGKTRLVQAVAKAIGIDPREVVSPTFVLVHEYAVPRARTSDASQSSPGQKAGVSAPENPGLPARAIADAHQTPVTKIYHLDGWTFVEWADRVAHCLPREYVQINIEITGPTNRRFTLTAKGPSMENALHQLQTVTSCLSLNPEP
jgi:tRNA threonylcarbamoyladenosine biosynthesis protein TsaE